MKNIFKFFTAAVLFTGLASCEDEQDLVYVTPDASFEILTPVSGEGVVLDPETPTNPALVLAWEDVDYGSPTEVTYTVQIAANGTDFAAPVDITSTTNSYASIDSGSLNGAAVSAGLTPFVEGGIDVRVMANVGTQGGMETYSNTVVYLVTTYSTDAPKLAVPGNHQGWTPSAADVPLLAASGFGETDYEGYVWLDGGYKLLEPDASGAFAWGAVDYGDDGTFTGQLLAEGEVDILADTPGYYKLNADTGALTYSAMMTEWGLIGSATAGVTGGDGWVSDADMTYDQASRTWSITMDLGEGAIKFRANDDWGLNYGDNNADSSLEEGGSDIIVTPGNYTITLDLSNPREYTYTLQAN